VNWRVLIPDGPNPHSDLEQEILGPDAEIHISRGVNPTDVPDEDWQSADAILIWHFMVLDRKTISKLKRCRVIVRIGAGYDNVDIVAAGEQGILVCNSPDDGTKDVAEQSLAM